MEKSSQLLNNPSNVSLDPDKVQEGLAELVLTVIELLRQLVERQAMRRVENGSLTDEEEEKLGEALYNLEEKMEEMKEYFGLTAEDLNIDLGPLGNLL
ncbi:gas vesicle protein K [Alkalicoccus daliensis]|uniref:Gas vesicle protein K n=1 Tax=Alkalicoccus daliensis TaxID=745820 RepID=A0A1H0DTP6_9BACI|nr:gas vesicle protein K [Alkalicoccus daliensis]SDN73361.1 Gas vesicle protein K [Alkalicoccus daliensis]